MVPVIEDDAFFIDVVVDAVEPGAHEVESSAGCDDDVEGHVDLTGGEVGFEGGDKVFLGIEDDGEVEVAVDAVVAAGAGAEGYDLEGVGGFDDGAYGLVDALRGDAPIECFGLSCHAPSPGSAVG
jgi:hypothetical protein